VKFSRRVPNNLQPNPLSTLVRSLKQQGRAIIDLTDANPTRAGFDYPADLLACLSHPRALTYAPEPLGLLPARQAVAADMTRRGLEISSERIALTSSTSEAYALLFKLLCNPGDEVLVPRPSYPLFEHLTRFESVDAIPYSLEYHGTWVIDVSSVERAISPRTKAVLIVSPNNPTGNFMSASEVDDLVGVCASAGLAMVADEVFADYELVPKSAGRTGHLLKRSDVLGFTLGGLSKSVGLPQVKLAWIAVSGNDPTVLATLERLELLCDTYLSVSTPVQTAAAELLQRGSAIRRQIQERVQANFRQLHVQASASGCCEALSAEGGWYAVLRVPTVMSEEESVLELLRTEGVLTHPGYFFDFASESFLVLSLIVPEADFARGAERIFGFYDRMV
jgi:aspartate/methionine/tyrosine aminotransferase